MSQQSAIQLLIVGDCPIDVGQMRSHLRKVGEVAETTFAADPKAADAIRTRAAIDLVILTADETMPTADDIRRLAGESPPLPVILVADRANAGTALAAGAADLVAADDEAHLAGVIQREMARLRQHRQLLVAQQASRENEARANTLMLSARDAIAYIHEGMHITANDAYLRRFGYENTAALAGTSIMDLVDAAHQKTLKQMLRSASLESGEDTGSLQFVPASGKAFEAKIQVTPATVEGESCQQIVIQEPTATESLERQLRDLARRDPVTRLFNQQHFMSLVEQHVNRAEQYDERAALLHIRIVDFAKVRRRIGVQHADQLLIEVAGQLRAVVPDEGIARLEGADFGLLATSGEPSILERLAERTRAAIRDHVFESSGTSTSLTACIGIAVIDRTANDTNEIFARSERSLTDALSSGPDAHRIYQPKPGELSQKQIDQQWVDQIRQMLRDERFNILFQPIVSVHGDATERYRLHLYVLDDQKKLVQDPELIAAANRTGMSRGMDRWMVLNALKMLVQRIRHNRNTVFFIPLSEHAFDDSDLVRWIHERVKSLRLPKGSVVFETAAAGAASRLKRAASFSSAMHDLGYGFCLNQFGHGRDPFQLTRHVTVDYLRLHEVFVQDIVRSEQNRSAIRALVRDARESNIQTICPGVTSAANLSTIWTLGADLVEGDFLQKPARTPDYDFSLMTG